MRYLLGVQHSTLDGRASICYHSLIMMRALAFLGEVRVELEKVVWPTRAQTIKLTAMVILVTIVVGFFLGGIDFLLAQLAQYLLR